MYTEALCLAVLFLFALLLPLTARAHGGQHPSPSDQEAAQIGRPLEGARDFASSLAESVGGALSEEQMATLDAVMRHYGFQRALEQGRAEPLTPHDAAFNRWKAEQHLLELLEGMPQLTVYDLREGGNLPDTETPIPFFEHSQALLMKVVRGDGPASFTSQTFDLHRERYQNPYAIAVASAGTTYVLLNLEEVPTGKSTTNFVLRTHENEAPFLWYAFTLDPAPRGQLRIETLNEKGQPTPVLMRIRSMETNALWPPPGAMDMRPMLNDVTGLEIYGPGRAYMIPVPGAFAGHYWLVPEPCEMALPPGEWEVTLYHGIEYPGLRDVVAVEAGAWTRKSYTLNRWTDMAARGWYSGDDHVHARLMSSDDARKLMAFTQAMDIRVSNILEMGDSQRTYYVQRGFGPEYRVEKDGHWLVPGMEDPRSMLGHNIGLNLTSMVRDLDRYLLLDWIAREVHRQGGLFGQTHVGENACEAHRGMALLMPWELYDFCSILQWRMGTEIYYDFLDLGYQITATAGSDTPYGGTLGHVRLYAHVDPAAEFTPDAWFDAIEAGRTFATNGPMISFSVNGALPGTELDAAGNPTLKVEARAWGIPGESAPVSCEIVVLSEVAASSRADKEGGESELEVSVELPAGDGCWIAARAQGANGSAAHTTPVYVKREGRRHWNPKRAGAVIARQLEVLDEIEEVIAQAESEAAHDGLMPAAFWSKRIVQQANPLRERVAESRRRYEELRTLLAQ